MGGLTLEEALHIFEGDEDAAQPDGSDVQEEVAGIYIGPPEPNILKDEDSADEDEGGLIDNLTARQLTSDAEIVLRNNIRLGEIFEVSEYAKNRKRTWIEGDLQNIPYDKFATESYELFKDITPVECFEMFLTDEIFTFLRNESNNYALFKNMPDPQISVDEIKVSSRDHQEFRSIFGMIE